MTLLGLSESDLVARGGVWTAREILQQPQMLRETQALLQAHSDALDAFLQPLLSQPDLRIILTGAGSSAFIGECLAPLIGQGGKHRIEAIATTDIVGAPQTYLRRNQPTLMVSFARSGDSPESVAAVCLADQCIDRIHHLMITCNGAGQLAKHAADANNAHLILLPEPTHDQSFAMTSSFTCMMYAALAALTGVEAMAGRAETAAIAMQQVIDDYAPLARRLADRRFSRMVVLGANAFKGLASEAALKLLELSDGQSVGVAETPLGFRHGPKAILNGETLVVALISNHPHGRLYDLDLLAELETQQTAGCVLAITAQPLSNLPPDRQVVVKVMDTAEDADLLFPYIAVPQMLAFYQSLALGKSPDNPNPSGIVNRVVQSVTIHALP